MSDLLLRSGDAEARVALRGGELTGWQVGGTPLIWSPDPAVWSDSAPILFPVVGWTRGGTVRVGARTYPLGLHGFARTMPFVVAREGPDTASLVLSSSPATKDLYPFDFRFTVTYRLAGPSLAIGLTVEATGPGSIPYACGLHPGFRWPFAGGEPEDYAITFAEAEDPSVPVISPDGLFTAARCPVPLEGRDLRLSRTLFAREALCFLNARSRVLTWSRASTRGQAGGAALTATFENFPHLALWSRPPARFLSIEAWTGHGDGVDADGDLWRKPSMIHLPAGHRRRHAATFTFHPGPA